MVTLGGGIGLCDYLLGIIDDWEIYEINLIKYKSVYSYLLTELLENFIEFLNLGYSLAHFIGDRLRNYNV